MKQYHTQIVINAPVEKVWQALTDFDSYPTWNPLVGSLSGEMKTGGTLTTYIVPLQKTYHPTLLVYQPYEELTWQGIQGAKFLMAGKHYYKLKKISKNQTQLSHGEWFTGLMAYLIPKALLQKMEAAFVNHNQLLKQRIEHEN
ncbi:MAG: SRPBCC domain-containing protein [Spirosomataceae bacterium]